MNTIFYLVIIFFISLSLINLSYSAEENLKNFSNSKMGLELKYPSSWILSTDETDEQKCDYECWVSFEIPNTGVHISINKYNLNNPLIQSKCICNTLKDYVKWVYENDPVTKIFTDLGRNVISDSPVNINNISGWEMQSTLKLIVSDKIRESYNFWILQDDAGYTISYAADEGMEYQKYLPEVKNMTETVNFIPIEIPQKNVPSFLQ